MLTLLDDENLFKRVQPFADPAFQRNYSALNTSLKILEDIMEEEEGGDESESPRCHMISLASPTTRLNLSPSLSNFFTP